MSQFSGTMVGVSKRSLSNHNSVRDGYIPNATDCGHRNSDMGQPLGCSLPYPNTVAGKRPGVLFFRYHANHDPAQLKYGNPDPFKHPNPASSPNIKCSDAEHFRALNRSKSRHRSRRSSNIHRSSNCGCVLDAQEKTSQGFYNRGRPRAVETARVGWHWVGSKTGDAGRNCACRG